MNALNQLIAPVRRRLDNLVARAVVKVIDDSKKLQLLQLAILDGETRDLCERFQEYGFTSVPLAGAEAVVVFVGGHRDHPLVLAVDDRTKRKTGLQPGEVALYTDEGKYLLLKRGGTTELNQHVNLTSGNVYKVAGTQVVGPRGSAVADSTATAASVSAQLNLLLSRVRDHGLIAP